MMRPLLLGAALLWPLAAPARQPPSAAPATNPSQPAPTSPLADRIDAAIASGLLDTARELIARGDGLAPAPRLALARAELAAASGSLDEAAALYTPLADDAAVGALAQQGLGIVRLRQDRTAPAIVALDAALARDPSLARAWTARGVAADRVRDWLHAERSYARALALDPRSAAAFTNRGYSRLLRGAFAEAATDLAQAVAIDPKLNVARNNLRLARAMGGDYKGAFTGSTKSGLAGDLNTVGFAAMTRGDYRLAETYFTRAMQISPEFDRIAWANLVYLKQLTHKPLDPGAAAR